MSIIPDKALILKEIIKQYNFRSNKAFADYLGIATTTLSSWFARNTFDIDLLYAKCENIDGNFLLTGVGNVFLKEETAPMMANDSRVHYESGCINCDHLEELLEAKNETIAILKHQLGINDGNGKSKVS